MHSSATAELLAHEGGDSDDDDLSVTHPVSPFPISFTSKSPLSLHYSLLLPTQLDGRPLCSRYSITTMCRWLIPISTTREDSQSHPSLSPRPEGKRGNYYQAPDSFLLMTRWRVSKDAADIAAGHSNSLHFSHRIEVETGSSRPLPRVSYHQCKSSESRELSVLIILSLLV